MQFSVDGDARYMFNFNDLAPEEIHGIEVYPGPATVPAEFASMLGNGPRGGFVWTRRDR